MRCSGIGYQRPGASFAPHAIGRPFDVPPYAAIVAPPAVVAPPQAEGPDLARCVAADPVTRTLR
jgi:hypothetical protein